MAKYRTKLLELSNIFFITGCPLETTLVYKEGIQLPLFTPFHVLKDPTKKEWIKDYFRSFIKIAIKFNVGILFETTTWRANPDWLHRLGYTDEDLISLNHQAVQLISDIRDECEVDKSPIVISGCIGPRGDGYNPTILMTADEAQEYHTTQINVFSKTNVDMVAGFTLTYPEEAVGITRAAMAAGMPVVISFTVDVNGKLPTGQTLKEAVIFVDQATNSGPIYYMVNCIHPSYLEHVFSPNEAWTSRIHGIKGNASKKSHSELDAAKELDSGDPVEFGEYNRVLLNKLPNLNIVGGCCGTDYRHIEEICKSCISTFKQQRRLPLDGISSISLVSDR